MYVCVCVVLARYAALLRKCGFGSIQTVRTGAYLDAILALKEEEA